MTCTVDIRAMTALKRDGSALIPASLVNVMKGGSTYASKRSGGKLKLRADDDVVICEQR